MVEAQLYNCVPVFSREEVIVHAFDYFVDSALTSCEQSTYLFAFIKRRPETHSAFIHERLHDVRE